MSTLSFLVSSSPSSTSRTGTLRLTRSDGTSLSLNTPGLVTATSRGVVPHLSPDLCAQTAAVRWVHTSFESFLDHNPTVPTLFQGKNALACFLGHSPSTILSLSLRDPGDVRLMPPNGDAHVSAVCVRGVRKVTPASWRSYVQSCDPDITFALTDVPFTAPPYSQKRLIKSVERSLAWLADVLRSDFTNTDHARPSNIFVHMAGGTEPAARAAFSEGLVTALYDKEAEAVKPLKTLDEGVAGYTFDLAPLRVTLGDRLLHHSKIAAALVPETIETADLTEHTDNLIELMNANLKPLPRDKPRLVNSCTGPHEILKMVKGVGVDLFDAAWAQRAADIGIALDFQFPVPERLRNSAEQGDSPTGKWNIGYNLYDQAYAHDFHSLLCDDTLICPCIACTAAPSSLCLQHSIIDSPRVITSASPFTRAYLHHLLHTHEMSSHALLTAHNLSVLDAFFGGIRKVLGRDGGNKVLVEEVRVFCDVYDASSALFDQALRCWAQVELARGKGRLAREKVIDST
ncbi:tRNA-guanine transglycosylase [Neolentinus lepideus HHB14362 ss-1]|uniref:tRNA-guanine transglycosylase n=1 Tax=Neolentinus lepideus HHB14362 ss-1 TaxID=1314782 RepID=A0A165QUE7_9AGAM|nr:tRNA-guanine transglycosylase [Neolentinus lepideus HHB14362 ss-1]